MKGQEGGNVYTFVEKARFSTQSVRARFFEDKMKMNFW
jgi:hypothetical protein